MQNAEVRRRALVRAGLIALVAGVLAACEGGFPMGGSPEVRLVVGEVTIAADGTYTYDFGEVGVGSSASATFRIRNDGNAPLALTGVPPVAVTGAGAASFGVTAGPTASIAAGGEASFVLTFTPAAAGPATASVAVESDDANEAVYRFTVSGVGVVPAEPEPDIEVLAGTATLAGDGTGAHSFGSVNVGQSASATFVIRNIGDATLALTGTPLVTLAGAGAPSFAVTTQPGVSAIAAGQELSFVLVFEPLVEGQLVATVTIASDDPDEPSYAFSVSGTGLPPEPGELRVRLLAAPPEAEGKTLYGVAGAIPGEPPIYLAMAQIVDGGATLLFFDQDTESTIIPGGSELTVSLFVDMNGVGPDIPGSAMEWPDYGDLVPTWPATQSHDVDVTIVGDVTVELSGDDLAEWTEKLLILNLTNGAEIPNLEGKMVYSSLYAADQLPPAGALAGAGIPLVDAELGGGQQVLLFRLPEHIPYSMDAVEMGADLALSVLVDMDGSYVEGDYDTMLTEGDYFLWWPSFTPSMLDIPQGDDVMLDFGIGTDVPEYFNPV